MSTIRFTYPFPSDNSINPFGDYKWLVLEATRHDEGSPITKTWSLVGNLDLPDKNQPIARCLTPEQAKDALEVIFLQIATKDVNGMVETCSPANG